MIYSLGEWKVVLCCAVCGFNLDDYKEEPVLDNHSEKTDEPMHVSYDSSGDPRSQRDFANYIDNRECPECKTACPKVKLSEQETAKKGSPFKYSPSRCGYSYNYKYRICITNILPLPTKKRRAREIILTPSKVEWVKKGIFSKEKITTPAKTYIEWEDING